MKNKMKIMFIFFNKYLFYISYSNWLFYFAIFIFHLLLFRLRYILYDSSITSFSFWLTFVHSFALFSLYLPTYHTKCIYQSRMWRNRIARIWLENNLNIILCFVLKIWVFFLLILRWVCRWKTSATDSFIHLYLRT